MLKISLVTTTFSQLPCSFINTCISFFPHSYNIRISHQSIAPRHVKSWQAYAFVWHVKVMTDISDDLLRHVWWNWGQARRSRTQPSVRSYKLATEFLEEGKLDILQPGECNFQFWFGDLWLWSYKKIYSELLHIFICCTFSQCQCSAMVRLRCAPKIWFLGQCLPRANQMPYFPNGWLFIPSHSLSFCNWR